MLSRLVVMNPPVDEELSFGDEVEARHSVHPRAAAYSWSSDASRKTIRFRTPVYNDCPAPQLRQVQFSGLSTPDVEKQTQDLKPYSRDASPKCLSRLKIAMYSNTSITPGILRPEEQQSTHGRCHHQDNRFHRIIDTGFDRRLSREQGDLASATTLIGSPSLRFPTNGDRAYYSRDSASSSSSYSTQASDGSAQLSTNRLLKYYAAPSPEKPVSNVKCRTSHFSGTANRWQECAQATEILSAQDRPRLGSAPPPYQPGSRKGSEAIREKLKPKSRGRTKANHLDSQTQHAEDIFEKNVYVLKLCKAFLLFGIQAHRLEEYMHATAAYLGINAEFQYVPHCMFVVLTSPYSHTNEIHLLKESTSVDLGKLEDIYEVYVSIVHDEYDLPHAVRQLDKIVRRERTYSNLLLILLHGLAATCAGTFAFSARPIDFAPLHIFGCLLAVLQLVVLRTPIRSSHILEVITSIIIAFCGRALGSMYLGQADPIFCFSGIVQGTIALILPGHIILAATHEIQNRQVLSGSVKMIYAILYTLFLGFGILIGAALFGFLYPHATNATQCHLPWYWATLDERWRATYSQFIWVPIFAAAISIMHQAKPKHLPAMAFIATCGHQAFYWSLARFAQNLQFSGMIAAFASGLLANLYAQWSNCLAATILLPAVLVHIPNALAASGSLVAGIDTANSIVSNTTYRLDTHLRIRDFVATGPSGSTGLILTSVFGMAQATIGITVGLFLCAFVIYPFTKKKAGSLAF